MSIDLSLVDAANNCERRGAVVTITLKSGRQFTGTMRRTNANSTMETVLIDVGEGWVTILKEEIVAVQSRTRREAGLDALR